MRNFQDTSETHKRSFISAFSIFMTVKARQNGGGEGDLSRNGWVCHIY